MTRALGAFALWSGMMGPPMTGITDEMCKRAISAMKADRIQGFSTPVPGTERQKWGAPHYVRDEYLRVELWRGDSHDEMIERCRIEEMRLALHAALATGQKES